MSSHVHLYLCFLLINNDSAIGLSDGRAKLAEYDRFLGHWNILLSTMTFVVHANAHQFLRVVNGSFQAKIALLEYVLATSLSTLQDPTMETCVECCMNYTGGMHMLSVEQQLVCTRQVKTGWLFSNVYLQIVCDKL